MPGFFSRLKSKDGTTAKVAKSKKGAQQTGFVDEPVKPKWEDAWTRNDVEPEEIQELIRGCTLEVKSRGMVQVINTVAVSCTKDTSLQCHKAS